MHSHIKYLFSLILLVSTFVLCEVSFRAYDYVTTPHDNRDNDVWIQNTSREVEEHPLLGYRYPPGKVLGDFEQADEFGMPNVPEALELDKVDVVGIGDSYVYLANRVFFERFKAHAIRYHSLALFGYGPGTYNIMMREYGPKFNPKVYLYCTYLGNDPGDVRRYESWLASGKSWYDFNGGYFMPIQRKGYVWGWHLFLGRARGFARNVISRVSPETYGALKGLIKRDDSETVFEYAEQANELARRQQIALIVLIVPRMAKQKPFLDPIVTKLIGLCAKNEIACIDLDPAFGDMEDRDRYFASDGHWNEAGMQAAWTYLWDRKLSGLMSLHRSKS